MPAFPSLRPSGEAESAAMSAQPAKPLAMLGDNECSSASGGMIGECSKQH